MKRFLLALAVTGISANAWAATIECNKVDVASACKGYDKKPNDCLGVPTLVCPFDREKVFCAHKHCEVGDILYADGRCYGSSLPIPKNKGTTMMPMGVIIDPDAKLAMLPIRTIASTGLAWQDIPPANAAWSIGCMNRTTEGYPNATYTSSFPVPVGDNYEVSDFDINACGGSNSNSEVETQINNGISFNWNISPLLKRIFNPLNKFTPIKSVHAASLDDDQSTGGTYYPPIVNPCQSNLPPPSCTAVDPDPVLYTAGCALPYIATDADYCMSHNGQGGSFYTHMLMEFKNASETMSFIYLPSTTQTSAPYGDGLDFPAAEYCTGITGISFDETSVSVEPFLPSIADWTKVFTDKDKIAESLAQIDPNFEFVIGSSGKFLTYTGVTAVKKRLESLSGFWTSQQAYSESDENKTWDSAYYVNSISHAIDKRNSQKKYRNLD